MRTTVTLEPDTEQHVRRLMRERGMTFKEAVNHAIRSGIYSPGSRADFSTPTFDMGPPAVPLDRALALAGELEDEELARRLATRQ
jgi:hypothetical protein